MRMIQSIIPTRTVALAVAVFCLSPAFADAEDLDCDKTVRDLMAKTDVAVPVRYQVTTEMNGQEMENTGITETAKRSLTMDANGIPVSLFVDGKFYTTQDKGKSWKLQHEYSDAELKLQSDSVKWQSDNATNIACRFNIDLDGKAVHHYAVDYPLYNTDSTTHSEYWADVETGFVWKAVTVSEMGATKVIITQHIQPDPEAKVPVPVD